MYKVDITLKTFHFKRPAITSRGVYKTRQSFFVTLRDTDTPLVVGMGECATLPDLSCDAMPAADYERKLHEFCNRLEETGQIDRDSMRDFPSMLFGLESAMAQLKAGGNIDFFNTPFGKGQVGIPINGLVWMGTFDEMLQRLDEKIKQGFKCIKLKIGAIDFERELELIHCVRSSFSRDKIELRVDANGAFTPKEAMARLEYLAMQNVHSIEQPIAKGQWKELSELCTKSPVPIALDEELIGLNHSDEKKRLLDTVRPRFVVLKPSLHGGMSGTTEWVQLAEERGIRSWITSALESNIGLNAVSQLAARLYPNTSMAQGLGTGQLFEDNISFPIEIRGEKLWIKL